VNAQHESPAREPAEQEQALSPLDGAILAVLVVGMTAASVAGLREAMYACFAAAAGWLLARLAVRSGAPRPRVRRSKPKRDDGGPTAFPARLKWALQTTPRGYGIGLLGLGVAFFGLGGGVPETPWDWSFDLSEQEAESLLAGCPEGAVLVVHSPPKGYVDEAHGRHMGSEAILAAVETKRPQLVVCGHIHESWGREATIGGTPVVNLGPNGRFFEV
jgi:hypothetical protein